MRLAQPLPGPLTHQCLCNLPMPEPSPRCQLPRCRGGMIHPGPLVSPTCARKLGRGGKKASSGPVLVSRVLLGCCCSPDLSLCSWHRAQAVGSVLACKCSKIIFGVCVHVHIYSVTTRCSREEAFVLAESGAGQGRSAFFAPAAESAARDVVSAQS